MSTINAIIIDDKQNCRDALQSMIVKYHPEVSVLSSVSTVKEGLETVKDKRVDAVFLDILLEGETGFDFLNALEKINFSVVFITAYEKFALKAFQYAALDYLLKPIDAGELKNVIKKLHNIRDKNSLKTRLENFIKTYKPGTYPSQLALNSKNEIEFVKLDEILFCEADGFYTRFFLDNSREILVCKNIKEYEILLPAFNFFRIHKSYLVNRFKIKKIIKKDGGYVLMSNGKSLPISQRKKEQFMEYVLKNI